MKWEKDGVTYPLVKPLTQGELKAIDDANDRPWKALFTPNSGRYLPSNQLGYWAKMQIATVRKCFGLAEEQMDKLTAGDIWFLFDKVVEYSSRLKR